MRRLQEFEALARRAAEEARIAEVRARGHVPPDCGPEIPEAPARGPVRAFRPMALYPNGENDWEQKPAGHMGRAALQVADAFDVMAAQAARRKAAAPFTPGQVAMGRWYRTLVERHAAAGLRCSSVEALRASSGGGGSFIDAVLRDRDAIARLRARIGEGEALSLRKVRPSKRGARVAIPDRALVDMVCLEDATLSDVLRRHGWAADARVRGLLRSALAEALDRMAGPRRRPDIAVIHL
ncbi:hypothetical protein SAMN05444722_1699 [Rhodovulum sp. ES.010]|uniref:hypothetical protein n=1 Tax=Rhodovulum sp. ES.010 TaxID=1882821 RepID=UPI000929D029|nr:hypothetical protein [Rhodovulum sp. ES.010]SIO36674.1 hypothetical protein SAMN05444722_1699 [Rhodovulum sp. ES.010]